MELRVQLAVRDEDAVAQGDARDGDGGVARAQERRRRVEDVVEARPRGAEADAVERRDGPDVRVEDVAPAAQRPPEQAAPPARPLRAIVMRESLAAPFVHSNELGDRQASPLWELSGGARVWEHFVRLTGGTARRGALWSRVPLGEVAVVGELALRVQGEGAAPVDPARAAGLALWVARRPEDAPSLEAAFRAAPLVDDARVVPDAAAVGVVLSAGAARVLVRQKTRRLGVQIILRRLRT